jgi:hypothetical protein
LGGRRDQNIPHCPEYPAGSAGYITLYVSIACPKVIAQQIAAHKLKEKLPRKKGAAKKRRAPKTYCKTFSDMGEGSQDDNSMPIVIAGSHLSDSQPKRSNGTPCLKTNCWRLLYATLLMTTTVS